MPEPLEILYDKKIIVMKNVIDDGPIQLVLLARPLYSTHEKYTYVTA